MTLAEMRAKRDQLDALIATARAERTEVERQIRLHLYRASAAAARLERLNRDGRPIENPVHPALSHEERRDDEGTEVA